jgi:hypothetical protein
MKIGDIINYKNYSEAVKWCNENNAKFEEVEPSYENVEVPESGFFDEAGDYIILEEKHTEKREIRRFKIVEISKPTNEEISQRRENAYIERTDTLTLRKLRKQALGEWTTENEKEYVAQIQDISAQIASEFPYNSEEPTL